MWRGTLKNKTRRQVEKRVCTRRWIIIIITINNNSLFFSSSSLFSTFFFFGSVGPNYFVVEWKSKDGIKVGEALTSLSVTQKYIKNTLYTQTISVKEKGTRKSIISFSHRQKKNKKKNTQKSKKETAWQWKRGENQLERECSWISPKKNNVLRLKIMHTKTIQISTM